MACGHSAPPPKDPNAGDTSSTPTDDTPKWEGAAPPPTATATGHEAIMPNAPQQHRTDEYDKEQTEIVLKRAARIVKANCGQAKDDNGKATGPWGKTTVTVMLGHNGHSKAVTVQPDYDGKPSGKCIVQAFDNLTFPPWSGSDTPVDWEVEVVQPGK